MVRRSGLYKEGKSEEFKSCLSGPEKRESSAVDIGGAPNVTNRFASIKSDVGRAIKS
jgi:hypothetical protein